jgi:indole-3-glycerol phosphate synthase
MNITLDQLVTDARDALSARKARVPEIELYAKLAPRDGGDAFYRAVTEPFGGDVSLIAEIKHRSPSAGVLAEPDEDSVARAHLYETAGADAVSYVSDAVNFGGHPDMVRHLTDTIGIPVLQKDFVVDNYQIVEAAVNGAHALLLIARILDMRTLAAFVELCYLYGIEPVVEIYDEKDLEKALATNARIFGVNARDLDTFAIDIDGACSLGRSIPEDRIFIGFSGVRDRGDVERFRDAGARAVLVGTTLMRAENIEDTISHLKNV